MDVLDEEVYTWRAGSAARGLSADTDPVGLLAEVDALAQLAADAPEAGRQALQGARNGDICGVVSKSVTKA